MNLNNKNGFTLLELIIAVTLSVVIFAILFASLRLGYKSRERGQEKAEATQKIRIIGDRISWLIRGSYPFTVTKPDGKKLFFEGNPDRIGFVTTSVDSYGKGPEDIAGLKWVSIFRDSDGLKIREKVFFLEDAFDDSGGKIYLLDPDVRKLEFEYFDLPEDGESGEWVSDWDPDEKDYLPSAVKARIYLEHNAKPVVMPEIIISINARKRESF
ncbi:MAG: prepilin-type N-terminal cleavage/methylation domain-containing protein [Nitrospirota bacterium]